MRTVVFVALECAVSVFGLTACREETDADGDADGIADADTAAIGDTDAGVDADGDGDADASVDADGDGEFDIRDQWWEHDLCWGRLEYLAERYYPDWETALDAPSRGICDGHYCWYSCETGLKVFAHHCENYFELWFDGETGELIGGMEDSVDYPNAFCNGESGSVYYGVYPLPSCGSVTCVYRRWPETYPGGECYSSPVLCEEGLEDACVDDSDLAVLGVENLNAYIRLCAFDCMTSSARALCIADCILENVTALSDDCATCYGEREDCVLDHCRVECEEGLTLSECRECQEANGCDVDFSICAGIEGLECLSDGFCDESCDSDPDCSCSCDFAVGVCEAGFSGSTAACGCDPDCEGTEGACVEDDYCDGWCQPGSDPDCPSCSCDVSFDICETLEPLSTEPCVCDDDCEAGQPCVADDHCDPWCPRFTDPDCISSCTQPAVVADCTGGWCRIPAGCFTMGSPPEELGREPVDGARETQHEVTLTGDFEIQSTEVTRAQFEEAMGYPSALPDNAVLVRWHEAAAYCNALSDAAGLSLCYSCTGSGETVECEPSNSYSTPYDCPGYRLPTEAEWEYAARAGTTTATYNGDLDVTGCVASLVLDPIAVHCGNRDGAFAVGTRAPNDWGLYDMLGHVSEWCQDWYRNDLGSGEATDPYGPETGWFRIFRGGSVIDWAEYVRAAGRFGGNPIDPVAYSGSTGFRPVRSLP